MQADAEKQQELMNQNPVDNTPKLDLGLKEGQTIKINIAGKIGKKEEKSSNKSSGSLSLGLPPPPSRKKDDFGDFGSSNSNSWVSF